MKKINCNVIVCGPAVGKTFLANHDKRFIDLDEIKGRYKYGLDNVSSEVYENGKLEREEVINNDSSLYAIEILKKEIKNNHIVLLSYNKKLIKYIQDKRITYCLVYASLDSNEEYIERMKKRNNNEVFISKMTNKEVWEKFYYENKNDKNPTYKIELKKGQYLSDIKDYFI